MIKRKVWLLIVSVLILTAPAVNATHLVGGSLTYEAAGKSNGYFVYKVKLTMYRDCKSSDVGFDSFVKLGIYNNNSGKDLIRGKTLFFNEENLVPAPAGTGNCTFDPNVCLSEGYYEDTIMVSSSSVGYHLFFARCCRNAPQNLINDQGQSYYAFIPSTDVANSSPVFSGVPAPYICASDEATIFNLATDADGDSLVYSIIKPLHGGSRAEPAPDPPSVLPNPLPNVNYATGYTVNRPFGTNSIATINAETGLTTLKSPGAGHFALAVEVKEYRNGTYIGSSIRDVQIIVLNCPPNPVPELVGPNGSAPAVSYTIAAGDLLSFDIIVTDADSMYMNRNGSIFNSVPAPLATLANTSGEDTISSRFSWQTSCDHGSNTPYVFTVQVQDNGCPNKTLNITYSITVTPHDPPAVINGPDTVCAFTGNITYNTPVGTTGNEWAWEVTGGTITGPRNKKEISVNFNEAGSSQVKMVAFSANHCVSDTIVKNVAVMPLPVADAGKDQAFCSGDTINIGPLSPNTSYNYQWLTKKGLSNVNTANPKLSLVNTGDFPISLNYLLRVSNQYCSNKDTLIITINPLPKPLSITGDTQVCYQSFTNYSVKHTTGSAYQWWVNEGDIVSGNGTNTVQVNWNEAGKNILYITETNSTGCTGDTSSLTVEVLKASTDTAYGSEVVCPNSSMVDYWVTPTPGSEYFWEAEGGIIAAGGNTSQIKINWGDSGLAFIKVVEVNSIGCVGDTVFYPVTISYRLKTKPIQGPAEVCEGSEDVTYSVQETNGSNYAWMIKGGTITSGNGTNSIKVNWGTEGTGELSILETSRDEINNLPCKGDTVSLKINITPVPKTSPIAGSAALCTSEDVEYSVTGFSTSRFIWSISGDQTFTGNESNKIRVKWEEPGIYVIKVFEVTQDSCTGNVQELRVEVNDVPETSNITGPEIVCVPDGKGITYSVNGLENSKFNWIVTNGVIKSGQGTDEISVDWKPTGTGEVSVLETSDFGCVGDTINNKITLDAPELHITYVTTKKEDEKVIELEWKLLNGENLSEPINIWRRPDVVNTWKQTESVQANVISIEDEEVLTDQAFYLYFLQSTNMCKKSVKSVPHNTILLKGKKLDKGVVDLAWNSYKGWKNGATYHVMRRLNEQTEYELYQAITDTLMNGEVSLDGYEQCYRIRAVSNEDPEIVSWSNEICFSFDAVVWIPNAFTPDPSPDLNDEFYIEASNFKSLNLKIYNRWGECIFANRNLTEFWDGTYNGWPVPEGIYTYTMDVENTREKKVYRGSITLIR